MMHQTLSITIALIIGMGNSISVTTDETKADKYASNIVLAVPLVGGKVMI